MRGYRSIDMTYLVSLNHWHLLLHISAACITALRCVAKWAAKKWPLLLKTRCGRRNHAGTTSGNRPASAAGSMCPIRFWPRTSGYSPRAVFCSSSSGENGFYVMHGWYPRKSSSQLEFATSNIFEEGSLHKNESPIAFRAGACIYRSWVIYWPCLQIPPP